MRCGRHDRPLDQTALPLHGDDVHGDAVVSVAVRYLPSLQGQDLVTYGFGATRTWQEWIVDFEALDLPVHNHPEFSPIHLGLWDDKQGALAAMAADLAALGWPSWLMAACARMPCPAGFE